MSWGFVFDLGRKRATYTCAAGTLNVTWAPVLGGGILRVMPAWERTFGFSHEQSMRRAAEVARAGLPPPFKAVADIILAFPDRLDPQLD